MRSTKLDQRMLGDGLWARLLPGSDQRHLRSARLRRAGRTPGGLPQVPSTRLASFLLKHSADTFLARRQFPAVVLLLALLLICAGPVVAWFGLAAAAFGAIAAGGLLLELAFGLQRIALPAFGTSSLPRRFRYLPDLAIFVTGVLAIEGTWYHRLFPPIILGIALLAIGRSEGWRGTAGDRVLGAALVALAAIPGWQEPALMLWSIAAVIVAVVSAPVGRQRHEAPPFR
jgi:hypothetical protein